MIPGFLPIQPQKLLVTPILCLVLMSCESGIAFQDRHSFGEEYEWKKSDSCQFVVPVHDNSRPYRFELTFRYATGYAYDKLLLRMTETSPEGDRTVRDLEIPVRNQDGTFIGDKGFDIIDLTYVIDEKKTFPVHGNYTYDLSYKMGELTTLNYAMEIGLVLRQEER